MDILLVAALTFGLCFGLDKLFTKCFRSAPQYKSGKAVRLKKHYGAAAILLCVLGIVVLLRGISGDMLMLVCSGVILLMGLGLGIYYLSFGVFYDEDSFLVTTLGKKNVTYYFRDIRKQQLYNVTGGALIIELHMKDGQTVSLQTGMDGVYPFLDTAFSGWCRQQGIRKESCAFHDPDNSCWFPPVED